MLISPTSAKRAKQLIVVAYYAALGLALVTIPTSHEPFWFAPIALFLAFYFADFISGILHFALDYKKNKENVGLAELFHYEGSRGSPDYNQKKKTAFKKIGIFERIVFNFKLHHPMPSNIGRQSYSHLCSVTIPAFGVPVLLLDILLRPYFGSLSLSLFLLSLSFWMANSQYIHALPHKKHVPPFFKWLMKNNIIISKKKHAIHHATLDRDFCTINGYANPVVNPLTRYLVRKNYFTKDGLEPR